ncbi:hypothetical protein F5878DRAFT_686105 [Lentinula raphanica]|uniref:Uncharacterized protein n=1 Tax=Lentinula raphanica TaxID=153919 RepID=A0AA38UGK7_9AGAR|nr:hypothetical protein F5878DRAFT_686105 [Lentinula raphanica]
MTRLILLPSLALGILFAVLAASVSPEVLAAPSSLNRLPLGRDSDSALGDSESFDPQPGVDGSTLSVDAVGLARDGHWQGPDHDVPVPVPAGSPTSTGAGAGGSHSRGVDITLRTRNWLDYDDKSFHDPFLIWQVCTGRVTPQDSYSPKFTIQYLRTLSEPLSTDEPHHARGSFPFLNEQKRRDELAKFCSRHEARISQSLNVACTLFMREPLAATMEDDMEVRDEAYSKILSIHDLAERCRDLRLVAAPKPSSTSCSVFSTIRRCLKPSSRSRPTL